MTKALLQKFWLDNSRFLIRIFIVILATTLIFFLPFNFLSSEVLSSIFAGVGAMMGGILAIVFTLNTFVAEQNSYFKGMTSFKGYSYTDLDRGCYLVLSSLIIIYFFLSMSVGGLKSTLPAQVFLIISIAVAIFLIDAMADNALKRTNIENAIAYAKDWLIKRVHLMQNLAKDLPEKINNVSSYKNNTKSLEIYLYQDTLKPFVMEVSVGVSDLLSLADKLSSDSSKSTIMVIRTLKDIFVEYIDVRKDNSLVQFDTDFVLAMKSDLEKFFEYPETELNRLAVLFGERNQENFALEIMSLYESIIMKSLEISKAPAVLKEENPLAQQMMHFFNDFREICYKKRFKEVIFQSHYVLNRIANKAIETKATMIVELAIDHMGYLMRQVSTIGYLNLVSELQKDLVSISINLIELYKDSYTLSHKIKEIFNDVFQFEKFLKEKYSNPLAQSMFIHGTLLPYIKFLLNKLRITEDPEIRFATVGYLQGYLASVRELSNENNKFAIYYLNESLDIIANGLIIILKDEKDEALRKAYVYLLDDILSFGTFTSRDFLEFIDIIANIGIRVITEFEQVDMTIMNSCIDTIIHVLEKQDVHDYNYPRGLLRLHFIGMVLLQKGYLDLYRQLREKIRSIDIKNGEQVSELFNFRDEYFYRIYSPTPFREDDIFSLMTKAIKVEDVDEYIFYTYASCDDRCSLKEEHEDRFSKQKEIIKLAQILRAKCLGESS